MKKRVILALLLLLLLSLCACAGGTAKNGEGIIGTWYADENGHVCIYEFTEDNRHAVYSEGNEKVREYSGYTYDSETGDMTFDDMPGVRIISVLEEDKLTITYADYDTSYVLYRDIRMVKEETSQDRTSEEYLKKIKDKDGWCIEDGICYAYRGNEETVTVPANVTEIYMEAFSVDFGNGRNLKKVVVPGTVKKVLDEAFAFTNADIIIFEEGVEELGSRVFMDAYPDEIHYAESIKRIGDNIMETEEGLRGTKIYVTKGSKADKYFRENEPYGAYEIIEE